MSDQDEKKGSTNQAGDVKLSDEKVPDYRVSRRRGVLKKALGGVGGLVGAQMLPKNWIKPVVDSVIVPAHAQTSPLPPSSSEGPEPGSSSSSGLRLRSSSSSGLGSGSSSSSGLGSGSSSSSSLGSGSSSSSSSSAFLPLP